MITMETIRPQIRYIIRFSNMKTMEADPMHKITTYYKIMFVTMGKTQIHWIDPIDGITVDHELTQGEFLFMPPQTVYYNENGTAPFDVTVLLFSLEPNSMMNEDVHTPAFPIHYLDTTLAKYEFPPKIHIQNASCMDKPFVISDSFGGKNLVSRIDDEDISRYRFSDAMKNILLYELLTLLVRAKEEDRQQGKYAHQTAQQLLAYINGHAEEGITCQAVAQALGYHPNYINKVIANATGMTFHSYLQDTKLRQAEVLVRTTKCTVSEIASIFGFYDISAFTRAYKKKYGITPYQYRLRTGNTLKNI